jgi:hypothetical protein
MIEGILTLFCVPIMLWTVPDYPKRGERITSNSTPRSVMFANLSIAKWLDEDDKQYIEDRIKLRGGGYTKAHATKKEILTTMFHPRMVVSLQENNEVERIPLWDTN